MNQDLEKLVLLQAIDLERAAAERQLAEGPKRVARVDADLAEARRALLATETSLRDEEAKRRRLESDAEDHRTKLIRLRKNMDAATSTAQVKALEHDIEFAEAAIAKLEDEELVSMEQTEALDAQLPTDRGVAERLAQTQERVKAEVAVEAEGLRARLAALGAERAEVRSGIEEARLSQYDRTTKSKGSAVAEGRDHKCGACQMMLRPQRWNDLTGREHEDDIFTCETCGRMLFWDPRHDRPAAWAIGDRYKAARASEA